MKNRLRKNEELNSKPAFKKAEPGSFENDAEGAIELAKKLAAMAPGKMRGVNNNQIVESAK